MEQTASPAYFLQRQCREAGTAAGSTGFMPVKRGPPSKFSLLVIYRQHLLSLHYLLNDCMYEKLLPCMKAVDNTYIQTVVPLLTSISLEP